MDLKELYEKQRTLDDLILRTQFNIDGRFDISEAHKQFITERQLAAFVELGELCNEIESFKYWKKNKKNNREKQLKEYVDLLHFFLSIGNTMEFTYDEIENAYNEKYLENIERQKQGY